ncbi:MAG: FAD-binding oxidoreductase [Geminicoccaceae bacterium]|nr:FAD-binding oxidoreductase [Geminicoccaceae bacterium]
MTSGRHYDVVIVGGGVVGQACAWFLACDLGYAGRVAVIERDPAYGRASSALSVSSIRQQFSTPASIAMSRFGFSFVERFAEEVALVRRGYLLVADAARAPMLEANWAVQQANGADVERLDPATLRARHPWLNTEDLVLATYGRSGEGWFDGYTLMQILRRGARAAGVAAITGEVCGFARQGRRLRAATLADGERIEAGVFVDAGGPWGGRVAAMAGIDIPVVARKRQVFVVDCRTPIEAMPMLFDPSGVYCRPEGRHFLIGRAPEADDDPDEPPLEVDHRQFEEAIWPRLAHRVPAMQALKVVSAWAGYYAYNPIDRNALIGPHPELDDLLLATGFSGHGMQHAPATGRGIAELIVHGRYTSLDLGAFAADRTPIVETNVY